MALKREKKYHTKKRCVVWLSEADKDRLKAMSKGTDLKDCIERLYTLAKFYRAERNQPL